MNEQELLDEFDLAVSNALRKEADMPSAFLLDDKDPVITEPKKDNGISINASLIKKVLRKGSEIDYCAHKLKMCYIDKAFTIPPTENMLKGSYGECGIIGSSADGSAITDLKRNQKNGSKSIDQIRIDQQILLAKTIAKDHDIVLQLEDTPERPKNVQVHLVKEMVVDGKTINIHGTLDIITPIKLEMKKGEWREYPLAVVDIKFTSDIHSTFGDYCWGQPENLDHIQPYTYDYLTGLPFVYWIFGWNKEMGYKFHPVKMDDMRRQEFRESVRKTLAILEIEESYGWTRTNPIFKLCKDCPIKDCKDRNLTQEV